MHTVTTHAAPSATDPRTQTTIERFVAADEPSHIHIPRPSHGTRLAAGTDPREETRR